MAVFSELNKNIRLEYKNFKKKFGNNFAKIYLCSAISKSGPLAQLVRAPDS